MVDKVDSGDQDAQPGDAPGEVARLIQELAQALTALGNFVAAATRISAGPAPLETDICEILREALGQHERATMVLRQLEGLINRKPA